MTFIKFPPMGMGANMLRFGDGKKTTLKEGEEGGGRPPITTQKVGEEGGYPPGRTTMKAGEEGGGAPPPVKPKD